MTAGLSDNAAAQPAFGLCGLFILEYIESMYVSLPANLGMATKIEGLPL